MALMPEDLENKRFTPVRFTEGYDMDEVDNYLDNDVIPRLKELIDENERLTRELEEARARVAELENQTGAEGAPAASFVDDSADDFVDDGAPAVEAAQPVDEPAAPAEAAPAAGAQGQSAAEIIALAQRLHDEHVQNGEAERDRLISDANAEHERIISEANETSRVTLEKLESDKAQLEKEIESLRSFERDYRSRLRNYLENQLRDLDTSEPQEKAARSSL